MRIGTITFCLLVGACSLPPAFQIRTTEARATLIESTNEGFSARGAIVGYLLAEEGGAVAGGMLAAAGCTASLKLDSGEIIKLTDKKFCASGVKQGAIFTLRKIERVRLSDGAIDETRYE